MVTHTRNLWSAFNPSKCTHTVVNTHPEQWTANAAAPGEQSEVRCLTSSHLSQGIEGGKNARYSLPSPTTPAGPEIQTHNLRLQVRHNCPNKTIHWFVSVLIHLILYYCWVNIYIYIYIYIFFFYKCVVFLFRKDHSIDQKWQ